MAQGDHAINESSTYIFVAIKLIVPIRLSKFKLLKLAEPHAPHMIFLAWRSLEVFACGWFSLNYLAEHPPLWLHEQTVSGSWNMDKSGSGSWNMDKCSDICMPGIRFTDSLWHVLLQTLLLGLVLWLMCLIVPRGGTDATTSSTQAACSISLPQVAATFIIIIVLHNYLFRHAEHNRNIIFVI